MTEIEYIFLILAAHIICGNYWIFIQNKQISIEGKYISKHHKSFIYIDQGFFLNMKTVLKKIVQNIDLNFDIKETNLIHPW